MSRTSNVEIAASLLAANMGELAQEARRVEAAGADRLHLDVMDGHFVPNLSFGPDVVRAITQASPLYADVHLMVQDPAAWITPMVRAGAKGITVHAEACVHLHRVLESIGAAGAEVGVSLNPATPVHVLDEVLPMVNTVLVMSVNPGFGGQTYIDRVTQKIEALSHRRQSMGLNFAIEVDGGINAKTIEKVTRAGATICVAGSAIFAEQDYAKAIGALRALVHKSS